MLLKAEDPSAVLSPLAEVEGLDCFASYRRRAIYVKKKGVWVTHLSH